MNKCHRVLNRLQSRAALCFFVLALLIAPQSPSHAGRAMWVWNGSTIITSSSQKAALFSFAASPHGTSANAVTKLYFAGGTISQFSNATWVSQMESFLSTAHSNGLTVFFLSGDPSWATSSGESTGLSYVSAVLNFNTNAASTSRFDGFQFDVEPYLEPGWPSTSLEQGLLNLLWQSYNTISASGQRVALSETIPFWYDSSQYGYLDQGVMDLTDEVAIMDYTNNAANLASYPTAEMNYASQTGKTVWIGVETTQQSSAPQTSFYGYGNADMESAFAAALPTLQSQACFAGYAIHDYTGYVNLGP